ncbi:MAG: nuclear transport factor 2 family protein [Acidobacteriota bacterium]
METLEVGKQLVALCREQKDSEAVDKFYAEDIVSIEGASQEGMPARMEGIDAVRGKHQWWYENHEVHSTTVEGPFCAEGDNRFVVHYGMDITTKATGERMQMTEVAIYTVENGKIVEERFLYNMEHMG